MKHRLTLLKLILQKTEKEIQTEREREKESSINFSGFASRKAVISTRHILVCSHIPLTCVVPGGIRYPGKVPLNAFCAKNSL